MAHKTKNGIILLNPAEKAKRFSRQLKNGKVSETGKKLTGAQKAYRAGYLKARSDNAKAFNSNKTKKSSHKKISKNDEDYNGYLKYLKKNNPDYYDYHMNFEKDFL